jgi:hypothetical protein
MRDSDAAQAERNRFEQSLIDAHTRFDQRRQVRLSVVTTSEPMGLASTRPRPGTKPAEPVIVDLDGLGNQEYLTGSDVLDDAVARLVDLLSPLHGRQLEHFEQFVGKLHSSWDEFHATLSDDD